MSKTKFFFMDLQDLREALAYDHFCCVRHKGMTKATYHDEDTSATFTTYEEMIEYLRTTFYISAVGALLVVERGGDLDEASN